MKLWEEHPDGILTFLFLLWEDGVTAALLLPLFQIIAKLARTRSDIELKKMAMIWIEMLSEVRKPGQLQIFDESSFWHFKSLLSKTKFYMKSISYQIDSALKPDLLLEYEKLLTTPSQSSHSTKTTGMSSTIVPTKVINADVPSSRSVQPGSDSESDEDLFLGSSLQSNTLSIPCSIWKKDADKSITYKSVGNNGHDMLIKLDLYDYAQCQGLSKENYWKTASYRTLFSASSNAPTGQAVHKLLKMIGKDFKRERWILHCACVIFSQSVVSTDASLISLWSIISN
uniref:Uncharacterized protein n=1 Tax=Cacopsylla melanoneura TaxID=428564 RepID=A0A8D9BDV3_9HEMI